MALVQSVGAARRSPDSGMSGEMANNSSDDRALDTTARPGVRWVNDYNGCKESHHCKPVLHLKTSFCEFVNNSREAWFRATNKFGDCPVPPKERQGTTRNIVKAASEKKQ
jgi:hypothetical protein